MRIPVEYETEIRRMISTIQCPWRGECCDPGVERHVPIHCRGGTDLIECHDKRGCTCRLAVPFGCSVFCRCPVRKYLVENDLDQ